MIQLLRYAKDYRKQIILGRSSSFLRLSSNLSYLFNDGF